jgi:predicted porin
MKKSLFAIAAVTAFAGAAQAQSSVTVYGIIDYGYQGANQTQAGPASSTVTAATNVVTKSQASGIMGSGQSTSRLGFRGNEDLGGGLSAFFTAEIGLTTDNTTAATGSQQVAGGSTANPALVQNRQTFIGLGKKGLGRASIGLQQTPFHGAVAATNAGGTNNVMGDVLYDRAGATGTTYAASGMSTNTSYTVRTSNALILSSENISGFQVSGMLVTRGSDTTQTGANAGGGSSNTGMGIRADYTWKQLFVTANYQQFNQEQTQGATAGTAPVFTVGYNGGTTVPGVNAKDTQQYYAATYDFGILKVFAGYINRKIENDANSTNYVTRTAQQIGVTAPITKTINVFASGGTGRINNTGANGPTANFTGWQLGSNYILSKRTNLYAIYGASNTANATTGAYSNANTSTANTSWNQSSYAVGMRHTF